MGEQHDIIFDLSARRGFAFHSGPPLRFSISAGEGGWCPASQKREGDNKTPLGVFAFRKLYLRTDRWPPAGLAVPFQALDPADGWCDDPADPNYNCFVRHPYSASAERLWREDGLYDVVISIGYNDAPVVPGHGSAIFIHIAREMEPTDGFGSNIPQLGRTRGCVSIERKSMPDLLAFLRPQTVFHIRDRLSPDFSVK
ncbi:MAG: L,D-transpeptidase family protein [Pseudomonadota bacterium]